ncbi:MAG: hypothetical protein DRJ68_01880 [Thermoprotei archaeon]|nr:MAG: hypothetical protein DRJ68_01880 [Thermoprotei archaeon]
MSKRSRRVVTYRCRGLVKGRAMGEALVSSRPISFLGGVDPSSGVIVERGHDLEGLSVAGKVLIIPHGKGSTVGSYVLYSLAKRGLAPSAIVTVKVDLMTLTGCVISGITLLDGVPREALADIKCRSRVEVDGFKGLLKVHLG